MERDKANKRKAKKANKRERERARASASPLDGPLCYARGSTPLSDTHLLLRDSAPLAWSGMFSQLRAGTFLFSHAADQIARRINPGRASGNGATGRLSRLCLSVTSEAPAPPLRGQAPAVTYSLSDTRGRSSLLPIPYAQSILALFKCCFLRMADVIVVLLDWRQY